MTAIINYGVGNLFSLTSSFAQVGEEVIVTDKPNEIICADRVVLPGVGAFADAARKLRESGLDKVVCEIAKVNKPLLGICLGMQLLFDRSYEFGCHDGLGLIKGAIRPITDVIPTELKVPHMGWNMLHFVGEKRDLFKYVNEGDFVYFVHSYYAAECDESITSYADYGAPITASVQKNNIFGTQFHPEKSGKVGLAILKSFTDMR